MLIQPSSDLRPVVEGCVRSHASDWRRKIGATLALGILANSRASETGPRGYIGQAHKWIRLYAVNVRACLLYALNGRTDRLINGSGISREIQDDVALLKGDGSIVAASVEKPVSEALSLRIEAGSDDAELKRFHRSLLLPCGGSDQPRVLSVSRDAQE